MSEKFDVVIIGAGIGGLVCGCYLAKSGLKVLIVEQHNKPGGYCTSFTRKGFTFDVGVHYLGSCRQGGIVNKILDELSLTDRIKFVRTELCDRIITPDKTIFIHKDIKKTQEDLIKNFPQEKNNICNIFDFILNRDFFSIVGKTKNLTFKKFLNEFTKNSKLQSILSIPLIGNLGLHPNEVSALISIILYKEFLFDPGYYPVGGVQVFPDTLLKRFKEYGGKILFSTKVTKIITKNRKIKGIKINNTDFINTDHVVSNADATLTFKELLDCETKESQIVNKLFCSPSAFILYLGLNKNLTRIIPTHHITWSFLTYRLKDCYGKLVDGSFKPSLNYLLYSFPSLVDSNLAPQNKSIMRIFLGAQYLNANFWNNNKQKLIDILITRASQIIPNIKSYIEVLETATPNTFFKYTSNKNGALFGWAPLVNQIDKSVFPQETSIENLFLAGHWTTNGIGQGGIAVVALSGKYAANTILRKTKKVK